ncbi:MAG: SRPBCC family protein [Salinivirgaceae bacterium]|nr:SRPBCC family protein [Salinivirgaceae bacterium]
MKALKTIFIISGILILIVLAGYFFPSKISLERSLTIDAPVEMIYDQVDNLHLWEKWSPWHKIDSNMKITYNNSGIGKEASYTWKSDHKSVGNGTLTITDAKPFEFIDTEMDFGEQGKGSARFKFEESENGIIVTWNMHSDIGNNPLMRWMGLLMKKSIKDAYDRGLADIDAECQYLKKQDWFYVSVKNMPSMKYYGIMDELTIAEIPTKMGEYFTKLYTEGGKKGIEIEGAPFALYYTWGETIKMECAVPVYNNSINLKGIAAKVLPEQKFAIIEHIGSYENSEKPHIFMDEWLTKNKYKVAGPIMEIYKKGPMVEQDPNNYVTYIMYPIN